MTTSAFNAQRAIRNAAFNSIICLILTGCHLSMTTGSPAIEFTKVPRASDGGPNVLETIEGRAPGAKVGQRIVLYSKSGAWWIQPFANKPFTEIQSGLVWKASIHLGTDYAALLVDPTYVPGKKLQVLPSKGDAVSAVARVQGTGILSPVARKTATLQFSGYEWEIRQDPSPRRWQVESV